MSLIINVTSVKYSGSDIGDDVRVNIQASGKTGTKNIALSHSKTWKPTKPWKAIHDAGNPKGKLASVPIVIKITERDIMMDDVGSATMTIPAPTHSMVEKAFSMDVKVAENTLMGGGTAVFTVDFTVTYISKQFETLWNSHPVTKGVVEPCKTGGVRNFENQCAIRMGIAIQDSGTSMTGYPGAFCWHKHGKRHALRVEQLAAWLKTKPLIFGTATEKSSVTEADYAGKVGIVAFINFYGTGNQGDHIDLWDGKIVRKGSPGYFKRSQKVIFWQL